MVHQSSAKLLPARTIFQKNRIPRLILGVGRRALAAGDWRQATGGRRLAALRLQAGRVKN